MPNFYVNFKLKRLLHILKNQKILVIFWLSETVILIIFRLKKLVLWAFLKLVWSCLEIE